MPRSAPRSRGSIPRGLRGTYYQAVVPDTLDLAQHAGYGINHFTSIISEENDYEMYWGVHHFAPGKAMLAAMGHPGEDHVGANFDECSPPVMIFMPSVLQACQAKALEAMAMLRVASGSKQLLERERKMVNMMISRLGKDDGLFWVLKDRRKPWLGPDEFRPYVNVHGVGRMLRAMIAWYQYTNDPAWRKKIDRMVDGIDRLMVVHKDDYAYFPVGGWMEAEYFRSCYTERGWKDTTEPSNEKAGEEGSLFNHQGHMPGALANWYVLTGNKQALRLSGELVRFLTQPKFWADFGVEYPEVPSGAEHAHWEGHFHGHINTLRAILEYAIAANDPRLKLFAREGYEWARQRRLTRIGYVSSQGCGAGRLIGLAVKLTEAGVGDYWEDVDQYIRNHGIELQFVPEDIPFILKMGEGKPPHPPGPDLTENGVIEATVGAFTTNCDVSNVKKNSAMCCSSHGNMGIFYAWDATVRYSEGVARVNLLLNRASPWIDIDSYLPYEGKVVLRNKAAKEVLVRMPLWVDKRVVACRVDGKRVRPEWSGSYLQIRSLRPTDVISITFPVTEQTERWTLQKTTYTCKFKGNTLVEISPPLLQNPWLYHDRPRRYTAKAAPMKEVKRFVSPIVLKW